MKRRLLALILVALLFAGCIPAARHDASTKINGFHSPDLAVSLTAERKAQAWAEHLAGGAPYTHSNLIDGMAGVRWDMLGEVVGRTTGNVDNIIAGWLDSPTHRSVLVDQRYTHVGVGVAWDNAGRLYVVAVFVRIP